MNDKKYPQDQELQLLTIHHDFDQQSPTKDMSFEELSKTLDMIFEIERLHKEIIRLDQTTVQDKMHLN